MGEFNDIIGHDFIKESLQKAIATKRIAHAYIIDAGDGSGKKLLANTFAKTLSCEKNGSQPCNECISCRAFSDGNNPDVLYVLPTKRQDLGVDDIREQVSRQAQIKPYKYKYKIFIIDNADNMTIQAQNALLKTLEEPPGHAIFILLCENYRKLLPTITSRCIIYRLKAVHVGDIENYLIKKSFNKSDASLACSLCDGRIGKALSILEDENFKADREEITQVLSRLPKANLSEILLLAKSLEGFKDKSDRLLDIAYIWFRDALVYKSTKGRATLLAQDLTGKIKEFSRQTTLSTLVDGINSCLEARANLSYNGNYLLTMEVMLLKMAGF